jgi:hypothetical protein
MLIQVQPVAALNYRHKPTATVASVTASQTEAVKCHFENPAAITQLYCGSYVTTCTDAWGSNATAEHMVNELLVML